MPASDWPRLSAGVEWLDRSVARDVQRLRARYQLSLDEFRGLYISDEQIDALVAESLSPARARALGVADPIRAEAILEDDASPLATAARQLDLSLMETALLMVGLAPELDAKYEILYAYLNDDVTRKWPTTALAERLLALSGFRAPAVRTALAPDGRLSQLGVLMRIDAPGSRPLSLQAGFSLSPVVTHALLELGLCSELATCVSRRRADGQWEEVPAPAAQLAQLQRIPGLIARESPPPLFAFLGRRGSGRVSAVGALAHAMGLDVATFDLEAARSTGTSFIRLGTALSLHLRLHPAVLVLAGVDECLDGSLWEVRTCVRALRGAGTPVVLVAGAESPWRRVAEGQPVIAVDFDLHGHDARRTWDDALDRAGIALAPDDRASIADRFRLPARDIELATAAARHSAALDGRADPAPYVLRAAKRLIAEDFGALGSKVETRGGWSDLVLAESTLAQLRALSAAVRVRRVVFDDWDFGAKSTARGGLAALFAGPSGTGKTMTAAIVARELGLDMYRVDLSAVVSKYIGETEKNLERIFRAARAGHILLFFDEADALFGKRSEVKDAHDRYANIEVAYLLQRLEDYDGLVILATNLRRNVDEAFARRLQFVIEFPPPDATLRERLWRSIFPPVAPLADDIDWSFLARQFALTGGEIRNVALDAAFRAAQSGGTIAMADLVHAMARQIVKHGKMPSGAEFSTYFPLLTEVP